MATSEKHFQTELLKAMHALDWHAFKVTSITHAGIPDLYVKSPSHPSMWLELKYEPWLDIFRVNGVPAQLTKLQRHFCEREQARGGHAAMVICVGQPARYPVRWFATVQTDMQLDRIALRAFRFARERGQEWDVKGMLDTAESLGAYNAVTP